MTSRTRRIRPLAFASLLAGTLCAPLALAGDTSPLDKAGAQLSQALSALKDVKLGNQEKDEHLDKARTYLTRARAELLKAQGQSSE